MKRFRVGVVLVDRTAQRARPGASLHASCRRACVYCAFIFIHLLLCTCARWIPVCAAFFSLSEQAVLMHVLLPAGPSWSCVSVTCLKFHNMSQTHCDLLPSASDEAPPTCQFCSYTLPISMHPPQTEAGARISTVTFVVKPTHHDFALTLAGRCRLAAANPRQAPPTSATKLSY